jgi:hypothetical protein
MSDTFWKVMPFWTHSAAFVNSASDLRILVGAALLSFHNGMGTLPFSEGDSTHMTFCRAIAAFISETHIHILYIPQIQNVMKVTIKCGVSHNNIKYITQKYHKHFINSIQLSHQIHCAQLIIRL